MFSATDSWSRRRFLKVGVGGLVASALEAGGVRSILGDDEAARPLRLGLCGTNNSHAVVFSSLLHRGPDPLPGAQIVAFYAYDEENVQQLRELGISTRVDRIPDLIPLIDGVLCVTRDGSKHLAEATPFLEAGIPTFIDKPLATTLEEARRLVALAEEHGTPLMSCSALRYAPNLQALLAHWEEFGEVRGGTVMGMGETVFYGVHTVEMMNAVFGAGVDCVVNLGHAGRDMAVARYADGKTVSIQILRDAAVDFRVRVHGTKKFEEVAAGEGYYRETLQRILDFFRTGQSPIPLAHTLEIMAVLAALVRSREREGEKVYLRDL